MKKNILLILILSSLFINVMFGQNTTQDVIYLKDGSQIKGEIITDESEYIRIKYNGNVSKIDRDRIVKIAQEEIVKKTRQRLSFPPYQSLVFATNSRKLEDYLSKTIYTESNKLMKLVKLEMVDEIFENAGYSIGFKIYLQAIDNAYRPNTLKSNLSPWANFSFSAQPQSSMDRTYKKASILRLVGIARLDMNNNVESIMVGSQKENISTTDLNYFSGAEGRINDAVNFVNQIPMAYYFQADDLPISGTNYFAVNIPETSTQRPEAAFFIREYLNAFLGSSRFSLSTKEEWENAPFDKKANLELNISKAHLELKSGTVIATRQPFSGYEMNVNANLSVQDANNSSTTHEQYINLIGGRANTSETSDFALDDISNKTRQFFESYILMLFPIQSKLLEISNANKKGVPKEVALDNAAYFSDRPKHSGGFSLFSKNTSGSQKIYFMVTEPMDIYQSPNGITVKNKLATLEFKSIMNDKVICKVLSGAENIKSYLDAGKELGTVSIHFKPEAVKK
ncbi:MAG: hypothetical protein M9887_01980 [Chitinophagales bacterium]|nr:hypothetical protein [Chitinophagales bacterium]